MCRYTTWTRFIQPIRLLVFSRNKSVPAELISPETYQRTGLITLSFRWTEAAGGGFQAVRQYPIPISNTGYLSSQVQPVDLDSNLDFVATKLKLNNAPRCPSASW